MRMMEGSVYLSPEGSDEDGWMIFRTSLGDRVRVRVRSDGAVDLRFPKDKYELRNIYNVESTGDVVVDLVPKKNA